MEMSRKIFKLLLSRPRRKGSEVFCKALLGSLRAESIKARETAQLAAKMLDLHSNKKETHASKKNLQAA